ncbi:MAG TPA: protein TolR [Alphaproteobacteria bacterium]|nr:protein TolR [Alphaproteobacteria bacterium]
MSTFHEGWRRYSRRRFSKPMSDINVTPFVDVMLVLLVVFMVTAPLLTVGVQVDLPKTKAMPVPGQDEPLAITVRADGLIYLQNTKIKLSALAPRLLAVTSNNPDVRIFIRGDKNINYGRVMEVMGTINAAGFRKVALVTSRVHKSGNKRKRKKR